MPQRLIVQYTDLLHQHGPDSEEARAFLAQHADNDSFQKRAATLNTVKRVMGKRNDCQTCGGKRIMPMLSRVPSQQRLKIGKLLKINYSLGDGSGIELPMHICLDCGTVQGDWPLAE
jgi:hypothetical protein